MSMMFSKRRNDVNIGHKVHVGKMKMMVLASVMGLLVGCVSEAGYQRKLDRSVGMTKQELISEWGEPLTVFEHDELIIKGKVVRRAETVISFYKVMFVDNPGKVTVNQINDNTITYDIKPQTKTKYSCSTKFWLEKDRVVSYKHEGNNCVAY